MHENCHVDSIEKKATAEERQNTASALLVIQGMGCPNCAARVRNSLLSLSGVVDTQVLLEAGMAEITYNPDLTNVPALVDAVAQAGGDARHHYRAQVRNEQTAPLVL